MGMAPLDYGPVLLRMPFGSRLAADTLPSGCPCGQNSTVGTSPWLSPSFPTSCPYRVRHGRVPQPTRHYPRLWICRPSFERPRDFNPPDQDAAQHTLQAHPPLCPASVLWLSWVFHLSSSLNIEATGSQVPCSSQDRARATLMPDATLAVSGSPPALIPGQRLLPGSDVVHMLSTLHRWFTRVRLPDPHLTQSRRAFSLTLTTGALDPSRSRWFGARLRRPAPRDLPSSRTDIAWRTVVSRFCQDDAD